VAPNVKVLDKNAFLSYCNLPGLINDRLHFLFSAHFQAAIGTGQGELEAEKEENDYITRGSFIQNMSQILSAQTNSKIRFTFNMFDFD